jgi:hypothetical protein
MALNAQQVHIAHPEHVHICSAVGKMAGLASFNFDRWMLEHEWPFLFRVTFETDRILRRGRLHLFGLNCAMRIVAVGALDQPFVHTMMERHIELSFLLEMTRVAKLGLRFYQEELIRLRVVWGVAGDATHLVGRVYGVDCIHVLGATGVAGQATRINLFT